MEPCRSRVGESKKKKKIDTAGHRNPARRPRSGVRHVSDTDTTPKMACPCNLAQDKSKHKTRVGDQCSDQATKTQSDWASAQLLDLIEAVPYHEQFIHTFEEALPRGLKKQLQSLVNVHVV